MNTVVEVYVNAYIVTREYGGPEEGGWYYDAGYPVASVPVFVVVDIPDEEIEEVRSGQSPWFQNVDDFLFVQAKDTDEVQDMREELYKTLSMGGYGDDRPRHSVLSEGELEIYFDTEFAKPFPEETPYYS